MTSRPAFSVGANLKKIKASFLDRPAVISSLDRAAVSRLKRVGSLTRTVARRSMRKGGQPLKQRSRWPAELIALAGSTPLSKLDINPMPRRSAAPGEPPRYRTKSIRDKIFFVTSQDRRSVVIGPQIYKRGDTPGIVEFGGTSSEPARRWVAWWEGGVRKIRLAKGGRGRTKVKPRPYMAPAYNTAIDRLIPGIWQDSLK